MNSSEKNKTIYANPYLYFAMAFMIVLILYFLDFSEFNTKLDLPVSFFLIIAIGANLLFYLFSRRRMARAVRESLYVAKTSLKLYRYIAVLFLVLGIVEAVYSGGVPILGQVNYKDYGIPTIHVILVFTDSFYILNVFKRLFLLKGKKKSLIIDLLIALIPLVLSLSRGTIVILLLGVLMLYSSSRRRRFNLHTTVLILVLVALGIYIFGISGNYRMNHDYKNSENINDSSLILSIGEANQNFSNSHLPKTFFWSYIYATTPISNFQLNANWVSANSSERAISKNVEFAIVNFVPDFISKRIYPSYATDYQPWLVTPEFTASSAFTLPYLMLGWLGLYLFLFYELFFPIVYLFFVKKFASQYFDIAVALLTSMYVLMPFANFFTFSALSMQLLLPFFAVFFKNIVWS